MNARAIVTLAFDDAPLRRRHIWVGGSYRRYFERGLVSTLRAAPAGDAARREWILADEREVTR